ncbi:ornithine cyclodeaminase family protein [Peteryoungia ipomoeae]|uniref:Ornithine cyclodeaminase family protein n=1 Tax=Peteryoungia ipomoeae TaxID=1210932 RepID=A0A4S8NWY8_9HYPH|nr:ornithine cyclodeaminase family protein [Peteryoungia ipomoeae]THV22107.1 ornithine cyclodeaminase family protein [Peteryoungia ipomoeae]
MRILDRDATEQALPWQSLIDALEQMFVGDCVMPVRHHHAVEVPGETAATLLLMPAWTPGIYIGVKLVTVFPDNHLRGLPAVSGGYLLSSGKTGALLALIDGGELTARRTAAASALAARCLSREDASHLLVVGTGRLALNLIEAHCEARAISRISVWGRSAAKAQALAAEARAKGFEADAVVDLEGTARAADIISCATLSSEPLIQGAWLKPGCHLDLIGAFNATMRESDDLAMQRARIFVDTRSGALGEAGDILQALQSGAITPDAILGDMKELLLGKVQGRQSSDDITLFKSVGAALEDLAGAILAYERTVQPDPSTTP